MKWKLLGRLMKNWRHLSKYKSKVVSAWNKVQKLYNFKEFKLRLVFVDVTTRNLFKQKLINLFTWTLVDTKNFSYVASMKNFFHFHLKFVLSLLTKSFYKPQFKAVACIHFKLTKHGKNTGSKIYRQKLRHFSDAFNISTINPFHV